MEKKEEKRDHWENKVEYFLAAAGNMVGVGNVWRFPYLCYKNGGGIFLVPYLFFAVLLGVPLFLLESMVGQYSQQSPIMCWTRICPLAKGIGYAANVIQLYATVYIMILVWALIYFINCFSDPLPWTTCGNSWNTERCVDLNSVMNMGNQTTNSTSGNLTTSSVSEFWVRGVMSMSGGIEEIGSVKWQLLLGLLACWVTCYFCIWRGVRTTGKVVYVTALFPYILLLILLIRGLTLPGAWQGVVYFLYPEPSRLANLSVWMEACAQVLFSYSVAGGPVVTLSSYNKINNKCYRDSIYLCMLNSSTSFLAGFVVFSTLGFMAQAQGVPINKVVDSGPGLAFIAYPQAATMMPLPQFWAACFFVMLLFLALDSTFTGLETIVSSVIDMFPESMRKPWRREIFLLAFASTFFCLHILLTTEGGIYVFQLIDYYGVTGACMLFLGMVQCLAVKWGFGADRMLDEVERLTGQRPGAFFKWCWCYITPLICLACFVCYFLDYGRLKSGDYSYPDWACGLGAVMALSSVVAIPIFAIGQIYLAKGSLRQRLSLLLVPVFDSVQTKENIVEETEMAPMSEALHVAL